MRRIVGFSVAVLALAASGCATSGDMDALSARVAQLEAQAKVDANRIGVLEEGFQDVASAADRASEAEANARSAASRADDAARKADAIFKKSVSK